MKEQRVPFVEAWVRHHPFPRLVQHFAARTSGTKSTADVEFGFGGALALLAVPGAFICTLLLDKYSSLLQFLRGQAQFDPYRVCVSDEYFFLVYSMVVTGLITVLRWDRLLPDLQDFANLAPLPLSLRSIFLANAAALGILAASFSIAINAFSGVVFPLLVTSQSHSFGASCRFAFVHGAAVTGISAFTFLAAIALEGLLMAALPSRVYRRAALLIRTTLLVLFAGNLVSLVVAPVRVVSMNKPSASLLEWWPPYWFLSWFEYQLGPLRAHSPLGPGPAWRALGISALAAALAFTLSYKRCFLRIAEQQNESSKASRTAGLLSGSMFHFLRPLFRPGLEQATFQFAVRTLLRTESHLTTLGLVSGLGLLLAMSRLQSEGTVSQPTSLSALLSTPLILCLFAVGGLRATFEIPCAAQANWPFLLLAAEGAAIARTVGRKMMMTWGMAPLLLLWFPVATYVIGVQAAVSCLLIDVLLLALTVELLLSGFQKIPFTCAFTPQRDSLLKAVFGALIAVLVVIPLATRIELAALASHSAFLVTFAVLVGALIWMRRRTLTETESERLLYEDNGADAFAVLRLGSE